jgi:hypothetical protein
MTPDLSRAIEDFSTLPMAAGKTMREMLSEAGPQAFTQAALPLLRVDPEKPGTNYLLTLLFMNELILAPLADPGAFSFEQAIAVAKQLVKIEPLLDIKMVRRLVDSRSNLDDVDENDNNSPGVRVLEIMAAISDGARILPMMTQLLRHPNVKIRSKAALLVGRCNKNCSWVEQRLAEPDPRVRANAIESLWGVESPGAKGVFWAAVNDPDNRVAGNALLGLYRLGEFASLPLILDLLAHAEPKFRISAVWIMGETGDPRFLSLLTRMIGDPDPAIRAAVFRCIAKLKQAAAKYQASPTLRVYLTAPVVEPGFWRKITASVWDQDDGGARPLTGLLPTQFVLFEESRLVTDYEIRENPTTEYLAIAFALPQVREKDDLFQPYVEEAFTAAIAHKRAGHTWQTVKYLSGKERSMKAAPATPAASAGPRRIFQIEEEEAPTGSGDTLPPDSRPRTDPEEILEAMEAPGNWMLVPRSPIKAMNALLPALSQCRGSRQLVLLYDPETPETDWARWRELSKTAQACRVNVHVVALSSFPELVQVTAATGGTFMLLADPSALEETLVGLCANLAHSYSIRYHAATQDEVAPRAQLRLRIYRPGSYGEGARSIESA